MNWQNSIPIEALYFAVTNSVKQAIQQTQNWVSDIVIGLNLCPFASSVFTANRIDYRIASDNNIESHLQQLAECFITLNKQTEIETSLLIFSDAYPSFDDYLDLLELGNQLLEALNYSGIYQLASFHPDYCFEGSKETDASNFTNRSPYPMLHILRESSIEQAISNYPNIDDVPENNIKKLQEIGYQEMQHKLKSL